MSKPKLILRSKKRPQLYLWDDYTYSYGDSSARVSWKIEGDKVFIKSTGDYVTTWIQITNRELFFIEAAIEADDIMKLDKEIEEFLSEDINCK